VKITKTQLLQIIKEETQGEMEFAKLEAARRAYIEDRNDDTRHELGLMVEKLVEPIMAELGLFFEAEAFYSRGELVFTNYRDTEVTIDPAGMMGRYDVQVYPLAGAEDDVSPSEISLPTMKGVAQYVADLRNLGPEPAGMVGEPEAQTELPLENKMRITKSQLQQVIREALDEEMGDRLSGKDLQAMADAELGLDAMSAMEAMEELEQLLIDIRQTSNDVRSAKQASRAEDLLSVIARG
jgi:hypothetical protein